MAPRRRRSRIALAAGLAIAAAVAPPSGAATDAPGAPGRHAAAQPAPTPTPLPDLSALVFGDPVTCGTRLRLEPLPAAVAVGDRITVTASVDVSCPDSLADAAVVVFAGNAEAGARPGIEVGLDRLGRALDSFPDTPLAVVDVSAADAPVACRLSSTGLTG